MGPNGTGKWVVEVSTSQVVLSKTLEWPFSQNFGSLALPVWDWKCLEDILTKGWVNQWMNDRMNE